MSIDKGRGTNAVQGEAKMRQKSLQQRDSTCQIYSKYEQIKRKPSSK